MSHRKRIKPKYLDLGRRERQIMEIVYRRGEATVGDVLEGLEAPPSYSAARTMLGKLEEKGLLIHEVDGPRYVYKPTVPVTEARRSTLRRVVDNLFEGSALEAMTTLLDDSVRELTSDELDEIEALIQRHRREGK